MRVQRACGKEGKHIYIHIYVYICTRMRVQRACGKEGKPSALKLLVFFNYACVQRGEVYD